jgi:hypothetical protein
MPPLDGFAGRTKASAGCDRLRCPLIPAGDPSPARTPLTAYPHAAVTERRPHASARPEGLRALLVRPAAVPVPVSGEQPAPASPQSPPMSRALLKAVRIPGPGRPRRANSPTCRALAGRMIPGGRSPRRRHCYPIELPVLRGASGHATGQGRSGATCRGSGWPTRRHPTRSPSAACSTRPASHLNVLARVPP